MDDDMVAATGELLRARAVGVVLVEVLAAARAAAADEITVAGVRAALFAGNDALRAPLSTLGIDSLTWMAILSVLEDKFDILFADEVALDPASYTVWGLAGALIDALGDEKYNNRHTGWES